MAWGEVSRATVRTHTVGQRFLVVDLDRVDLFRVDLVGD